MNAKFADSEMKNSVAQTRRNGATTIQTLLHSMSSTSVGAAFLLALFFLNIGMSLVENLMFLFYKTLSSGTYTCQGGVESYGGNYDS